MEQTIQLQFLDLDDVDHNEQNYVKSLLYSAAGSPRLKLPWVVPEEVPQQWPQEQYGPVCSAPSSCYQLTYQQDGEPEITSLEANTVPPTNEMYQVPVPVQTTMPQIFQVMSPITNIPPYVGSIPPHQGYTTYIYQEDRGRRSRAKPSPKRTERREFPPAAVQYPAPTYPIHVAMSPTPYPYISQTGPHIPSAQHAAGPPLYIAPTPPLQMFPSHHIYQGYTPPVYSPHVQPDEYTKEQPPVPVEEKAPEEKPTEKPPSLPINAIKTTAPPPVPVKKPASSSRPAPTTPTPTPVPPTSEEKTEPGKSWSSLFKGEDTTPQTTSQRKPPISAVAVNRPPKPSQAPPVARPPNPDEDPLLRSLGECLSSYQLEHKALVLTPRGLTNPSNYCYINATLQALLACPAFYNLIKVISQVKDAASGPPPGAQPPKTKTPIIDSMVQFIKEFSPAPVNRSGRKEKAYWKDKAEELDVQAGAPFEPTYVYKMLHALRNENAFQVEGRQEDAEEFLSLLLNGLNDEMLELVKLVEEPPIVNGDVTANGEAHSEDSSDWKEVSKGIKSGRITRRAEMGKTPLSEIFRGQLRSRLQRTDEESTDNVQPFFTLQLDIESSDSVDQALEKFFSGGVVEGTGANSTAGDMWQQHSLEELPNVLILHLKCFLYQQQSCHKIAKALDFTVDLKLDSKYLSSKNKNCGKMRNYKLFAVVYHDGKEASKGHYLVDAFHVGSGGWLRYDDSVVRPVTEATLRKPKPPRVPYLLYYRRQDTIGQHSQQPR